MKIKVFIGNVMVADCLLFSVAKAVALDLIATGVEVRITFLGVDYDYQHWLEE